MIGARVRRDQRLRRRADFAAVREQGRRASDNLMVVSAVQNGRYGSRFGLSVGRRVGGAVVRNRLKRRLRAALRVLPVRDGLDVVVSARPPAVASDFCRLRASLERLAGRIGALEQRSPGSAQTSREQLG